MYLGSIDVEHLEVVLEEICNTLVHRVFGECVAHSDGAWWKPYPVG
jgi:hypothetical protein